jgi:glycosyltransferase involved in cell wall biosynthesis
MSTIAVVIPFYEDQATLHEAIASVAAQDVAAEVLVVDDGSADPEALAALERAREGGATVIHQENQGPAVARTVGIRATQADYVLPLDADDRLAPGALSRLRAVLDADERVAAAWGSVRHFGAVEYYQRCLPWLDPWQLTYHNPLPLSALYRRSALLEVGGWQFPGGYEDWDLWMALAERGWRGVGVPELLAGYYRVHGGRRLSRSSRRHAERVLKLRARHRRLFAERARNRAASPAPAFLKVALPALHGLPLSATAKRLLGGAASHLAYREGWPAIAARYQAHRFLRAG